jgi:hypothetical protein
MASGHDVWFVSELSPAVFSRSTAPGPMAVFDQVKRLDGGLSFRHGLGLELNLAAADHENAKNLAMGLQALLAMAAMSEQKSGSPAELLKKLVIAYEDRSVKLGLSFDQAELDRGIDSAKMALAQGISQGFSGLQPVTRETQATQPPRAPEQQAPREDPAQPKVIKIYNAEGGTREIQLSPR